MASAVNSSTRDAEVEKCFTFEYRLDYTVSSVGLHHELLCMEKEIKILETGGDLHLKALQGNNNF